ncbi:hypothetical protein JYQ62_16560 [Nostoc sp. UHCC 0702]|nr:hypothetical protein JYQ62_16560 [Nostoc sp. UHCC 0702]
MIRNCDRTPTKKAIALLPTKKRSLLNLWLSKRSPLNPPSPVMSRIGYAYALLQIKSDHPSISHHQSDRTFHKTKKAIAENGRFANIYKTLRIASLLLFICAVRNF